MFAGKGNVERSKDRKKERDRRERAFKGAREALKASPRDVDTTRPSHVKPHRDVLHNNTRVAIRGRSARRKTPRRKHNGIVIIRYE